MTKSSAPEAPDLTEFTDALTEASQMSYQIAQDQLAWAQEQYAHDSAITDQVTADFLEQSDWAFQAAQEDRLRQQEVFQPIEDQLAAQAEYYATPEYKRQQMGAAAATTAQQVDQAVQASERELASYGVNPSAGKMVGTDIATRTGGAAATAAAGTQAAEATDAKALALASDVANLGKGYPASSTAYLTAAEQGGQGASQATTSATQTASNAMTAPSTYINSGTTALTDAGNITNQGYQNEIYAQQVNNQASSGWGTALGSIAGIATDFIPKPPTIIQTAHAGGPIQAQGGGAIPMAASPSRGAVRDDVPIMAESGEFVIPKKAVEWFGQKFFHDQIAKADKQKAETTGQQAAVPAGTSAPAGPSPQSTPRPVSAANPAANKPTDMSAFDFARWGQNYLQQPAAAPVRQAPVRGPGGSPPVIGPSKLARIPQPRPAVPSYAPAMPPGMAAGGAVAHYLPPGQAMTAAHPRPPVRAPARPVAPRMAPTVRMPAPGMIPISPTASPMVRSIRGMADGGTVDPGWVWDPGINKWVPTGPASAQSMDASSLTGARVANASPFVAQAPIDPASVYAGSVDASAALANARGAFAQVPVNSPVSGASTAMAYPREYWDAQRAVLPPSSPNFGMSGSAYAGGGAGYGLSGASDFPVGPYPPQIGTPYPASPNAPRGAPIPWTPPGALDIQPIAVASRTSSSRSGKKRSSDTKSGSSARKPKPRPTKKPPIIHENYPSDMTAFEFARQGQDYLRGKPYRATAALPSARSK